MEEALEEVVVDPSHLSFGRSSSRLSVTVRALFTIPNPALASSSHYPYFVSIADTVPQQPVSTSPFPKSPKMVWTIPPWT